MALLLFPAGLDFMRCREAATLEISRFSTSWAASGSPITTAANQRGDAPVNTRVLARLVPPAFG
jgi:hypothetical protein